MRGVGRKLWCESIDGVRGGLGDTVDELKGGGGKKRGVERRGEKRWSRDIITTLSLSKHSFSTPPNPLQCPASSPHAPRSPPGTSSPNHPFPLPCPLHHLSDPINLIDFLSRES